MYLKSIKAFGFKSFADKTELVFANDLTAIVGPNGSGKSNIVDAVRWVLGEQSIKALRGSNKMDDVIFSGSKTRSEATRCYIILTFDNTDHYLNSDFKELSIKRVLYRTGDNEYYINDAKVRLKDITDLFLDTGMGKSSFNIISQGTVTDIVNAKPLERRPIFEETAGVLKYKKRKEETIRKLDQANDNLSKINLLINELDIEIKPLKEEADKALEYNKLQEYLDKTEVSMLAKELTNLNKEYKEITSNKDILVKELESINLKGSKDSSKLENLKLQKLKYDEEINKLSQNIIALEHTIAELDANKKITIERNKYANNDDTLNNILDLKEETLNINKNIQNITNNINNIRKEIKEKKDEYNTLEINYHVLENTYHKLEEDIRIKNKNLLEEQNRLDILNNNIKENLSLPYACKKILDNPRFDFVKGTIEQLISVPNEYIEAINVTLGSAKSFLVVSTMDDAKKCINYLKDNKYGRATFFPIENIKPRYIDKETLNKVKDIPGFIDVASSLIKTDSLYQDVILNQLGNVLVVSNLDVLNKIGKLIDYKYRIVTLDGDITFTNGAITGGTKNNDHSLIKQKEEIKKLQEEINDLTILGQKNATKLSNLLKEKNELEAKLRDININIISLEEDLRNKNITKDEYKKSYDEKNLELNNLEAIKNNNIDQEVDKILNEYYLKVQEKDNINGKLNHYIKDLENINLNITDLENKSREFNKDYNEKQNILNTYEVKLAKLDMSIDNDLKTLNEDYNMTYDKALDIADLSIDEVKAAKEVKKAKDKIKALGDINKGAIASYNRLNERYTFLVQQQEDINSSINELLNIIKDMDQTMIDKFKKSFDEVSKAFAKVFKQLFQGGEGKLYLTDPDDLLNTGIDIMAIPPGKKLNSIALLSGGEKTLTALALLFAILEVRPVPFVILDEVEAALDDENVRMFGKYLNDIKTKTQFIIITHKKKTMSFVDTLYGITMQEQGVSKIVSVKLEEN